MLAHIPKPARSQQGCLFIQNTLPLLSSVITINCIALYFCPSFCICTLYYLKGISNIFNFKKKKVKISEAWLAANNMWLNLLLNFFLKNFNNEKWLHIIPVTIVLTNLFKGPFNTCDNFFLFDILWWNKLIGFKMWNFARENFQGCIRSLCV